MFLQNKKHIQKLLKKLKNERSKKYKKKKEIDFSLSKRDSSNQHKN